MQETIDLGRVGIGDGAGRVGVRHLWVSEAQRQAVWTQLHPCY